MVKLQLSFYATYPCTNVYYHDNYLLSNTEQKDMVLFVTRELYNRMNVIDTYEWELIEEEHEVSVSASESEVEDENYNGNNNNNNNDGNMNENINRNSNDIENEFNLMAELDGIGNDDIDEMQDFDIENMLENELNHQSADISMASHNTTTTTNSNNKNRNVNVGTNHNQNMALNQQQQQQQRQRRNDQNARQRESGVTHVRNRSQQQGNRDRGGNRMSSGMNSNTKSKVKGQNTIMSSQSSVNRGGSSGKKRRFTGDRIESGGRKTSIERNRNRNTSNSNVNVRSGTGAGGTGGAGGRAEGQESRQTSVNLSSRFKSGRGSSETKRVQQYINKRDKDKQIEQDKKRAAKEKSSLEKKIKDQEKMLITEQAKYDKVQNPLIKKKVGQKVKGYENEIVKLKLQLQKLG